MDYPGNSHQDREQAEAKEDQPAPDTMPKLEGTATLRKPSLAKRFRATFLGGETFGTALVNVIKDTLIPSTQDMILEGGIQILERTIRGDSRPSSGVVRTRRGWTPYNRVQAPTVQAPAQTRVAGRELSPAARANHEFNDIEFNNRGDAEIVLERLRDIIERYGQVALSDLYSMAGIRGTHVDNRWGWTNLRDAGVARERNGAYTLSLPRTEALEA